MCIILAKPNDTAKQKLEKIMKTLPNQKAFDEGHENLFGETLTRAIVTHQGKVIDLVLDGNENRYYINQTSAYYDMAQIGKILNTAESKGATIERFWA